MPQVTVQAEHPELGPISDHIIADAILAPLAQAAIEPKISAPVQNSSSSVDAKVKAGRLLAVLENSDLSRAQRRTTRVLTKLPRPLMKQQPKRRFLKTRRRLNSDLRTGQGKSRPEPSIVNSRKQLFAEGAIPGRDLDTAQAALVQAQAAYDAAAKHLESMRTSAAKPHSSPQRASSHRQKANTRALKRRSTTLRFAAPSTASLPIARYMPVRHADPRRAADYRNGNCIAPCQDPHRAKSRAANEIGDNATILVPGIKIPCAKVTLISPALDPGSTTIEIWLKARQQEGKLKVGTPVKVSITGGPGESAEGSLSHRSSLRRTAPNP